MRFRGCAAALLALSLIVPSGKSARAVPDDVDIKAFAKPVGNRLQLLVRVPFAALNDIQFPVRGDARYLDLSHIDSALPGAAKYWIGDSVQIFENNQQLPKPRVIETRVALASDKSFASYEDALVHLTGPKLPDETETLAPQSSLDILFEYPIHSDRSNFSIRTQWAHLGARVSVDLKFLPPEGLPRAFIYEGDPGLIRLDPGGFEVARQFLSWGFLHILNGTDYLLFLFCLVLPFPRLRTILPLVCAFALANSVTLIASALGQTPDVLWFPPLIETAIAVTILYVALENIAGGVTPWRRTIIAVIFGLIYGFSFAFGLASKTQYGGTHPVISEMFFNAGIELGLVLIAALMISVLRVLFRFTSHAKMETIVLSALAAHTAWHWMTERWDRLNRFPFHWPVLDATLLAAAMRWATILVILAGVMWFFSGLLRPKVDT